MATDEFERYVESWAPRSVNGHPALPRTLISGVPKERRAEAQLEVELGMPINEVNDRLKSIETDTKQLLANSEAQKHVNSMVADLARTVYGSDDKEGLRARVQAVEDELTEWTGWWDFLKRTAIGAAIVAAISAAAAIVHFTPSK